MRFFLGIMALVFATACAPFAAAHLPYFRGYAPPVALPGGDSGLLRRLYGDGIMMADPVRPVVIDKRGDVRALGPVGYAAEHSCSGGSCRVYVYNETSLLPDVYRFDPRSTKSTDVPSAMGGADALDAVMRAEGIYGFVEVPDLSVRVAGAFACLMQWWPSFVILLLIGGSAVPVWVCLGMAIGRRGENRLGSKMRAVLCAVAIALPTIGLYWLFLFSTAYPPLLSLIAVCIPTLVWLLYLVVRNDAAGAAVVTA
jgi:hypothetical protein